MMTTHSYLLTYHANFPHGILYYHDRRILRDNILAAQVEAALQGHDLGPFEPIDEPGVPKYQAFCHSCGKSVYANDVAVYSILEDYCPGQEA